MTRLFEEACEERARTFLERLGLNSIVPLDMMTVIIKLKHLIPGFNYLRVPDPEFKNTEAQWDSDKKLLRIRESTFQAMQRREPHAQMTLAHEFAHVACGHKGIRNRNETKNISERAMADVRREEREAFRVASALLAPSDRIAAQDTAEDIANRFGMSLSAARIRFQEVAELRRRAGGLPRTIPQSAKDFLRNAQRSGFKPRTNLD
jgi:Zn-dependent peptidase ImmA (M78 family)